MARDSNRQVTSPVEPLLSRVDDGVVLPERPRSRVSGRSLRPRQPNVASGFVSGSRFLPRESAGVRPGAASTMRQRAV